VKKLALVSPRVCPDGRLAPPQFPATEWPFNMHMGKKEKRKKTAKPSTAEAV
jgi:hypothetical protein